MLKTRKVVSGVYLRQLAASLGYRTTSPGRYWDLLERVTYIELPYDASTRFCTAGSIPPSEASFLSLSVFPSPRSPLLTWESWPPHIKVTGASNLVVYRYDEAEPEPEPEPKPKPEPKPAQTEIDFFFGHRNKPGHYSP